MAQYAAIEALTARMSSNRMKENNVQRRDCYYRTDDGAGLIRLRAPDGAYFCVTFQQAPFAFCGICWKKAVAFIPGWLASMEKAISACLSSWYGKTIKEALKRLCWSTWKAMLRLLTIRV